MSDEKKSREQPKSDGWIRKLERSVGAAATDPIHTIAKHLLPDNGLMFRLNADAHDEDAEPGRLHFAPPQGWRESHPFSVPKGMFHTDSGAQPFSMAVEGGHAMVMWLKPSAIAGYLPKANARQLLEDRAEAMCAALKNKCDIRPLEVRIYYPPQKIIDATAKRGNEVHAALILATDKEHDKTLRTDVHQLLTQARTKAEAIAAFEASKPPPAPLSSNAIEEMLAPHRNAAGEATLSDPFMGVAEIANDTRFSPELYKLENDGYFHVHYMDDANNEQVKKYSPTDLDLAPDHTHALIVKLHKNFRTSPIKVGSTPTEQAGETHDYQALMACLEPIEKEMGYDWSGCLSLDTPMGDILAIGVKGPEQEELLKKACRLINHEYSIHEADTRDWEQYLKDRKIPHIPPSPSR